MKEQNHSQEFHKLPVEAIAPPSEMTQLPAEYTIPEEYPKAKPQQAQKKRSHAKQIIAMCLAGFVAIQLLFRYFIPPFDPKKYEDNVQETVTPGGSSSGNGNYYVGDFQIKAMPDEKDDSNLKRELLNAAAKFTEFDYVRASLYLYNSMLRVKTNLNPYDLDHVGYSVLNSVIYDFRASADYCHIYYEMDEIWYENKIGELESYPVLRATMVLMDQAGGGTQYRVLNVMISADEAFGITGSNTSYEAQYIEGVFDADSSSAHCTQTYFNVYDSDDGNLDEVYFVSGSRRLTGPVANGAFMNGTLLESEIVYDETGDFVENTYKPGCTIRVNALLDDGCMNLNDPSVLDQTTGYQDDAWEVYKADEAIRYLAYTTYVLYKYDGSDDGAELYSLDITKPLLPLDMRVPFSIRQLIADNQDKEEEDTIPTLNPDLDTAVFEPGFCTAAQQLMQADYVGAAISLSDCLRANYEAHGSYQLDNAYLISVDGQLGAFTGQDLTDGSGVYIRCANEIVQVYNEKVDDYDPEMHFMITLIYAFDAGKGGVYTQVLTLDIAHYYLTVGDIFYSDTKYFAAELDGIFRAYDAEQVAFVLSEGSYAPEDRIRDGYGVSNLNIAKGQVEADHFCGKVLYRPDDYLTLNSEKTAVTWKQNMEDYAFALYLNGLGVLDVDNIEFQDDRSYEPESDESVQSFSDFCLDSNPYVYRIGQNGSGGYTLSVKAVENENGERVNVLLHIYDTTWDNERFPLTYTLQIWKDFSSYIQ